MEATTTRASTVIRSIPTKETRTQASITMPLSKTRSRTSMRLVPPEARSTGMRTPWFLLCGSPGPACAAPFRARRGERGHLLFQGAHLLLQGLVLEGQPAGADG